MTDEKSVFLKECLVDATFHLMKKKPINKITVDDIIKRAGVGRMTYFRNFTNKFEIIEYKLTGLYNEYFGKLAEPPKTDLQKTLELLRFIYSVKDVYSVIYKQSPLFLLVHFYSKATPEINNTTEDIYKTQFFVNGFTGIVGKWCEREFKETPEEIFEYVKAWNIIP